jgi:type IV pilus biogenesis protein CpaD/CtpE
MEKSVTIPRAEPLEEVAKREASKLPEELRAAFLKLVKTGEATKELVAALDRNPDMQAAAEKVLSAAAERFAPIVATMGKVPASAPEANRDSASTVARQMAAHLQGLGASQKALAVAVLNKMVVSSDQ